MNKELRSFQNSFSVLFAPGKGFKDVFSCYVSVRNRTLCHGQYIAHELRADRARSRIYRCLWHNLVCFFIYGLLNDTVSSPEYIASNDRMMSEQIADHME